MSDSNEQLKQLLDGFYNRPSREQLLADIDKLQALPEGVYSELPLRETFEGVLKILGDLGLQVPTDVLCVSDWETNMQLFRASVVEESGLLDDFLKARSR